MFRRLKRRPTQRRLLTALLYKAWQALMNGEREDDGTLTVDASTVFWVFEKTKAIDEDWDRWGEKLFSLTYDPMLDATDITSYRHVFLDRTTGYFHVFQGCRPDPGSFVIDPRLVRELELLQTKNGLEKWIEAQSLLPLDDFAELCKKLDRESFAPDEENVPFLRCD